MGDNNNTKAIPFYVSFSCIGRINKTLHNKDGLLLGWGAATREKEGVGWGGWGGGGGGEGEGRGRILTW